LSDPNTVELAPGDELVVSVTGAAAPAVRLEALEDGSVRLLPAGGEGTPGPFVHADRRAPGAPTPADAAAPHR
jgi:hypothetical protein